MRERPILFKRKPNPNYTRKIHVAETMADAAWLKGGLDGMQAELASLRRLDADIVIISEFERLYHKQCLRALSHSAAAQLAELEEQ